MNTVLPDLAVATDFRINRQARRISLAVCPARRRLVLTAPSERARREAYAFLESRSVWARGELARLPAPLPFEPGAMVPLRGAPVVLTPAAGRSAPVLDVERARLLVPGRADAFAGRVRRYLQSAAETGLVASLSCHCVAVGKPAPAVRLRDTRSRWGSCTADGAIMFSWRLICAPPFVLDYVAGHEAAHLVHLNHGSRFRALERRLCPRAEEAAAWLSANGPLLYAVGAVA